jgi:hypothetical protein
MENKKDVDLEEYVDQHRWLLNNGLVNDNVKNQLFFCGSIVHREVQALELHIDPENKTVSYKIYVNKDLLNKIEKYKTLSKSTGLFDMWRFKRLLKKEGSLDFQRVLGKFVKDFCGPKWGVQVENLDFDTYIDELGDQSEADGQSQQPNKLSD